MQKIKARINYVSDGDTINCTNIVSGAQFNSRANWIDAPETRHSNQSTDEKVLLHWQWGQRSKEFLTNKLQQFITNKSTIILFNYEIDIYGRTISDWYVNTTSLKNNLQYQLIAEGLAMPYLPFDRYDFSSRELILYTGIINATAKAYKNNLGFWADYKSGKFILPNEFKKLTI